MTLIDRPREQATLTALEEAAKDGQRFLPVGGPMLWLKCFYMARLGGYNNNTPEPETLLGYPIIWTE